MEFGEYRGDVARYRWDRYSKSGVVLAKKLREKLKTVNFLQIDDSLM